MNNIAATETAPLPAVPLPEEMNYVGVFLTFGCNLNCSYCINEPEQNGDRKGAFGTKKREMPAENWVRALRRLRMPPGAPITLQGGEPTLFGAGKGLGVILEGCDHKFDLLTNMALPTDKMDRCIGGNQNKLIRSAPYPSIRVSYHRDEMDRVWGDDTGGGAAALVARCVAMKDLGFTVSDVKAETDVGIYVVDHPENADVEELRQAAAGKVYFERKEFLGVHDGELYGTYKYPFSINLLSSGVAPHTLQAECRTSELLIDPLGFVWQCHAFIYEAWTESDLTGCYEQAERNGFDFSAVDASALPFKPIGHILDPTFTMDTVRQFRACDHYGACIGCDTKVKNDRFQSFYNDGIPHTSVEIRHIKMPKSISARVEARDLDVLIKHDIITVIKDADA